MAEENEKTVKPERNEAVALRYDADTNQAPTVVASGRGLIADKIREIAEEHGVPLKENAGLAKALGKVEIGKEIPPELYRAVAEILAYVFRVNQRVNKED